MYRNIFILSLLITVTVLLSWKYLEDLQPLSGRHQGEKIQSDESFYQITSQRMSSLHKGIQELKNQELRPRKADFRLESFQQELREFELQQRRLASALWEFSIEQASGNPFLKLRLRHRFEEELDELETWLKLLETRGLQLAKIHDKKSPTVNF